MNTWLNQFFAYLSFLITAGVAVPDALSVFERIEKRKKYLAVVRYMHSAVGQGIPLSHACEQFPKFFSEEIRTYMALGEKTGSFGVVCAAIAQLIARRKALQQSIVSACMYPVIICVALVAILALLFAIVVPKLVATFSTLHATLPLSTRILIASVTYVQQQWLALISIGLLTVCVVVIGWRRLPLFQGAVTRQLLRLPYVGHIIMLYAAQRLCESCALGVKNGLSLAETIRFVGNGSRLVIYRRLYADAAEAIEQGQECSKVLEGSVLLPPDCVVLFGIAERSGSFPELCEHARDYYGAELMVRIGTAARLIEPALMIGVGCCVGSIVISLIAPLYGLTSHVTTH